MFTDLFAYFVSLCTAGIALLTLIWFMRLYWQSKIREWAVGSGYKLISFRSARLQEGPQRLRKRRSERLFRMAVEDQMKARRGGWIMFTGFWGTHAADPAVRVIWDEWDE